MDHVTVDRNPWYAKKQFIRKKKNHSWTDQEIKQVYTMRLQKVSIDDIIEKLNLDVNRTQVYNILRMIKKSRKNKCFQCGHDLTDDDKIHQKDKIFKKCTTCRDKNLKYKQTKRQENLKQGKCGCCGRSRHLANKTTCIYCLSYTHRNRIAEGLCGACGQNPISPKSVALCEVCLEKNRINTNLHRRERLHANS
jgi:hypothetical protein